MEKPLILDCAEARNRESRLTEGSYPCPKEQAMPETAGRIESLFAAVALPPAEREAFLERECSGDAGLRDRLSDLLMANDRAGHVIDQPLNNDPDQTAGYAPTSEQPGTIVAGRYKLLEEISQGAWGQSGRQSRRPRSSKGCSQRAMDICERLVRNDPNNM